ncbi:MarR family winged helix-turn-helix transcriptional regulator [Sphingoaurantiacus capsulatus]|uniref:MarR family winged helix-turn-helix transcriptional regulator n=1 Tax=Sphingoaurantiacus capsulatus TaxID=1771310 RepID=A0ABV7X4S8_9SPHN
MTQSLRLDNFVPYRLSIASNLMSDAIAGAYRSLFGLNVAEWRLTAVLAERSSATQQELCAATRMDKVTVSRAAIALADRGLVERSPNAHDKRSHLLSLTESGRSLYAQVVPKAIAMEKALLADLSAKEIETLVDILRRLEARAEGFSEG